MRGTLVDRNPSEVRSNFLHEKQIWLGRRGATNWVGPELVCDDYRIPFQPGIKVVDIGGVGRAGGAILLQRAGGVEWLGGTW